MALRLWVEAHGADDLDLFAGVEKWRGRSCVPFEGSYGFGRDRITTGWLKASLRALDEDSSRPFDPVPALSHRQPLAPGQVVQADIALGPSATFSGQGRGCGSSSRAAGYGRATRSPASSPPPIRKAPKAAAPCTGDHNTRPASLVPIIP